MLLAGCAWGAEILTLTAQRPGARAGKVSIRQTDKGLLVTGSAEGGKPTFPSAAADLMKLDHVEIWLSVTPDPKLPVMGWGNQFEDVELPKGEASCAAVAGQETSTPEECQAWARRQASYRVYFKRLFLRQWQLAPGLTVESFAQPAYDTIKKQFGADKQLEPLAPRGTPQFSATPSSHGYDFQALIPWAAFPPSGELALRDIRLLVEVFSPTAYSTSSPGRGYGNAATFNLIHLDHPREYKLSPCAYPLSGLDLTDQPQPGYFFPSADPTLSDTFILENYKAGYAYKPSGLSPGIRVTHYFSQQAGPEEYVCGPLLRHKSVDLEVHEEDRKRQPVVDRETFGVRRQPNGTLLIKSGPRVYGSIYGSGQCGACPRVGLDVYILRPNGDFLQGVSLQKVVDTEDDIDLQVAPDWSRASLYIHLDSWKDEFYCLQNGVYARCGPERDVPPPSPRTLHLDRY